MPTDGADSTAGLGRQAVRGAATSGVAQLARMALQLLSVVIMARLLTPRDYGLVAMVLVVVGVAELFRDLGLSSAAIQAPVLTEAQRDNLLWLNACAGLILSLLVAAAAPAIAMLYDNPELTAITLALAPTFFLSGLVTQYRVDLLRALRFRALAVVDVGSAAIGLTAGALLAWTGSGYWALVAQQVLSGVAGLLIIVTLCRWLPGRFIRGQGTWTMVRFGWDLMRSSLLTYVSLNLDTFVVGHVFGAGQLGVYNRSAQLVRTPLRQAQAPFGAVMLPVLSRLRSDDRRFLETVRRSQLSLSYLVLCSVAVIVAAPAAVVDLALGPQWDGAADLIAWMAWGSGMAAAASPAAWIFIARGLGRDLVRYSTFTTTAIATSVLIGSQVSVIGVAAGYAIAVTTLWPITLTWVGRRAQLSMWSMVAAALRAACVALTGAAAGRLTVGALSSGHAGLGVLLAASAVVVVAALAATIPAVRQDYLAVRRSVVLLRRLRESPEPTPADRPGD